MNKLTRKIFAWYFLFLCAGINHAISQIRWDSLEPATKTDVLYGGGPNVMYADSNYLYMAGEFTVVNDKHMQGIARWNGVKWDSMGRGIDGLQYLTKSEYPSNTAAITSYHNKLYVSGLFTSLGNVHAWSIGTWDGTKWDSMPIQPFKNGAFNIPSGLAGPLAVINNKLYVGGYFDTVAGIPCIGIACWNDTNWSSLGFPKPTQFLVISSICEYNGSIYVGGRFFEDSVYIISRWDGKNWRPVGGGLKGANAEIWSMAVYQGELYVAGSFFQSDGNADDNIQRWDGTSWSAVGGGTDYEIFNLMVYNNKLYAMGQFTEAGGVSATSIAVWNGNQWCSLGGVFDNAIGTSCTYKDSLYVGGGFWTINGDSTLYVAEWVGGNYTDGCGSTAGLAQVKEESEEVSVYPNPSYGQFTLSLSNAHATYTVEIYNVLGGEIYTETLQQNQSSINITGQPNGVYLYRIISEKGMLVGEGKVVIQR